VSAATPDARARRALLAAGAALTLAILIAHAWAYRFLTDDAFISFRYARNLASGAGLVFNPGHERVEGYTNFLWVILLAAFVRAGIAPERIANALSMACGVGIWWLVLRASLRPAGAAAAAAPAGAARPAWIALAPVALLAATRSFAVWCTSGLETKFFELLVVAGVFAAVSEVAAARVGRRERWLASSGLLALACLTRPDGAVLAGGLLATRGAIERARGGARLRDAAPGLALFAGVLLAHLAFRVAYYGDWVPNTYRAKVGGRTWWSMGAAYDLLFAIEYGVLFWVPLAVVALRAGGPRAPGTLGALAALPPRAALVAGALLPFGVYITAIGGDHFEFRPLDVIFPLGAVVLADGAAALGARGRTARIASAALLAATLANTATIPQLGRLDFPAEYRAGFPGLTGRADGSRDLVSRERLPHVFRVPLVAPLLDAYNGLARETTAHAVGTRQEEHALFLPIVADEGRLLRALVERGSLPRDAHVAIGSVGAIPYFSDLRTLDRLGLTDREVALGPSRASGGRQMGHDKLYAFDNAGRREIDLWSADGTHLIYGPDERRVREFAEKAVGLGARLVGAPAGGDRFLLAIAPGSRERVAARLPQLVDAVDLFAAEAARPDAPWWAAANLADVLVARGDTAGAILAHERAIHLDPTAARPEHHLGLLLLQRGDAPGAATHLRRALDLDPAAARIRFDLGLALVQRGDLADAVGLLREGVAAAPSDLAMSSVLARFLATCPDPALRDGAEAVRIAERLRGLTRRRDARVLDTLATSYASVGRFADAARVAAEAAAVADARGDATFASEIRARAAAYAQGRAWF
jgi:tetratricopeptide (TPR) repeat protein